MIKTQELLKFEGTLAESLLAQCEYPWEALPLLKSYITELIAKLPKSEYLQLGDMIFAHKTAVIAPTAYLNGPLIIGPGSEIRHCAFIRGSALIGEACVVGNSTELKNSLLLNHVQLPHYNYAGDSVFGCYSHMGAGAITSNVKADHGLISIKNGAEHIETGLKKMGAVLGEHVEIGCNSVLNPGTIVGSGSRVYPLSMVRGVVPPQSIYKHSGDLAALVTPRS